MPEPEQNQINANTWHYSFLIDEFTQMALSFKIASSDCSLFENQAPIDNICRFVIFKWVVVT